MTILERMTRMVDAGVSTDVITMVFRSEGVLDTDIAAGYDCLLQSGQYEVVVERAIPRLVPNRLDSQND